jgi:L-ascorbate metabolism protein UlaG (beta-lactamase superfamily)
MQKRMLTASALFACILLSTSIALADRDRDDGRDGDACGSVTPAAIGGPLVRDHDTVLFRWLGTTNYEMVYRGQVILFDSYYDRGPRNRALGFTPAQVNRADAIFIGHGHFDHMSDAASIGKRLKHMPIVGGPPTYEKLLTQGITPPQAVQVTGTGGESFRFKGFTVEPVLAHHSVLSPATLAAFNAAIVTELGPPTPDQTAAEAVVVSRGTSDPRVITVGTIAYFVTFDDGFRVVWLDSAGPITDSLRAFMKKIGRVDLAIVAYIGHYAQETQIPITMALVNLFKPRFYMPSHHDEIRDFFLDMGIEPLFLTMRDQTPAIKGISLLYREAACFDSRTGRPVSSR